MIRRRVVAMAIAAYSLTSLAAGAAVRLSGPYTADHTGGWSAMVAVLLALPIAVLLLWHLPRHPVSVVLAIYVCCSATGSGPLSLLDVNEVDGLAAELLERAQSVTWAGTLPLLPLLFTLVPDGVPHGRWRQVFQAQVAAIVTLGVLTLLDGPQDGLPPVLAVVAVPCVATLLLSGAAAAGRLVVRSVRDTDVRRQVTPVAVVAAVIVALYTVGGLLAQLEPALMNPALRAVGYPFTVGALPAAIGYAVVRHRLLGIDIVLARFLVAGLTSLLLGAAYFGGVLALAAALSVPHRALPSVLVPAALVAFVLVPTHRSLQRVLTRAIYGQRGEPLAVLDTLGERLRETAPEAVPERVAQLVRDTLRLPWAAVEVEQEDGWRVAAQAGTRVEDAAVERLDLFYAGAVPGRLLVQPRRGESALSAIDRRLLRLVASQAAPAVAATQYVRELTLSRERLVLGREEERARLRRDLHDGLSPALSGISLALTAARQILRADAPAADALLAGVASEAARSSRDVRRILDDLRPPGLDELGLLGALEERGRSLSSPGGFTVGVHAQALPPLPAAVETAAYRIAVEAMTNSARHAGADRCEVLLSADGQLHLRVEDDGVGVPIPPAPGVGISSMTSRAADVGGRLRVERRASGGTTVIADLPLAEVL